MLTISLKKLANLIEMSFSIPETEQKEAKKCIEALEKMSTSLDEAEAYLDNMWNPFQTAAAISPEEIYKKRGIIARFRREIKDKFSDIKAESLIIIKMLHLFISDTHILDISNSFKSDAEALESNVEELLKVLSDVKSETFKENVVEAMDDVKEAMHSLDNLIKDRVIDFFNSNIINKDYAGELNLSDRVPTIKQLYQQRQQALQGGVQIQNPPALLNPGNAQKMWNPSDIRELGIREE